MREVSLMLGSLDKAPLYFSFKSSSCNKLFLFLFFFFFPFLATLNKALAEVFFRMPRGECGYDGRGFLRRVITHLGSSMPFFRRGAISVRLGRFPKILERGVAEEIVSGERFYFGIGKEGFFGGLVL
jgi:hypothetical protein